MISPTSKLGLSPPAALVTTKVSTPRSRKTLTGNVTLEEKVRKKVFSNFHHLLRQMCIIYNMKDEKGDQKSTSPKELGNKIE